MSRIYYTRPSISELEVAYATDAVRTGWGEKCYEYIGRFEKLFANHIGTKFSIATSSCTGAMHMGLAALGVGEGDEVILADINWIATVAPVTYLKAKPVFVDVLSDSWCLDPDKVEKAITKKTKAIIATHIYGNLCEMDELLSIGEKYSVPVIEDAAEAIGSQYKGKRAGSVGKFGVFSFHGTKTVTTGEGGMFVTNDEGLYEKVNTLSNHGRSKTQTLQFWPDEIGFKYKMSNVQAAIGCGQLERIDELINDKRRIFSEYDKNLSGLPVKLNPEADGNVNGYWMPTVVVDESIDFDRDDLLTKFQDQDVDARVFFWPLSMLPHFESVRDNTVSYAIYKRAFNLPSFHGMTSDDICLVSDIIIRYFENRA